MASSVSSVDFKQLVKDYNQSVVQQDMKLQEETARFRNVNLRLDNIKWEQITFDAQGFKHSKQVRVQTLNHTRAETRVTARSDGAPGSYINIVSGRITGIDQPEISKAIFQLPKELRREYSLKLDLSKDQQELIISDSEAKHIIRNTGSVTVHTTPRVYQGAFQATARFTGPVMFKRKDGGTKEVRIEYMAQEAQAKGRLSKPFKYSDNSLCWNVTGNMDLLLETVNVSTN